MRDVLCELLKREKGGVGMVLVMSQVVTEATHDAVRPKSKDLALEATNS